jgi:hypothetical protein
MQNFESELNSFHDMAPELWTSNGDDNTHTQKIYNLNYRSY